MTLFPFTLDDGTELRLLTQDDAERVFQLVAKNRSHLDPWLRWSGRIQTLDDARAYIQRYINLAERSEGYHAGMWVDGVFVGGVACPMLNRDSFKAEIGYWLNAGSTGRGLVTRASRALITRLFEMEKMHRIEIQCVVDNVRSRAVAERLGFTLEGIKRESEWITTSFRDHALYSLLDYEWNP